MKKAPRKTGTDKEKTARRNILRGSSEISGAEIKGYDFNGGVDYARIVESYATTGFQATHLSKAIAITNRMLDERAHIFLGYTSNIVSSGLREAIRYLFEHKKINAAVTTAGGVEEDIIKCMGCFVLGDFRASGMELRKKGINRIGNIFVPNSRYVDFEKFVMPLLEEVYAEQKRTGKIITPSELVWKLGETINSPESICYWAWKNKIKIYCPAITDGSFGDMIYFFKYRNPGFAIDVAEEGRQLNDSIIGVEKTGIIVLGAGIVKHSILNAHMYRNGAEYAVYINNAQEFDGSDAGALPEEAISWGKLSKDTNAVKIFGDATIIFPLLVAETFAKMEKRK